MTELQSTESYQFIFWNFRRQGGVKAWKPSVVGYGYFLELPNSDFFQIAPILLASSSGFQCAKISKNIFQYLL